MTVFRMDGRITDWRMRRSAVFDSIQAFVDAVLALVGLSARRPRLH